MLLIAYPELNFWFHAETGIAWLRDEDSSDAAVLFHCLTPGALAGILPAEIERIHLDIAAAYNNFGADEAEKDLPALPVSFVERLDTRAPAELPDWFMAVQADENPGTWIIHTRQPVFAIRYGPQGLEREIHPGPPPGASLVREARRKLVEISKVTH